MSAANERAHLDTITSKKTRALYVKTSLSMSPRRLNLELGFKSHEALERLQAAFEASSQAETIRLALQTLQKLVTEAQAGAKLVIERPNADKVETMLPLADLPRRR